MKNKLAADIELKYKHIIAKKDMEIDSLQDVNFDWKRKHEILITEYDSFKSDSLRDIELIKENHRAEIRELLFKIQLLNDKCETNVDKEAYRNIRQELDSYRKQITDMQNEISSLRKEKDLLSIEKNEVKLSLLKELDQEKLKLKMLNADYERNIQTVKNAEDEINIIREKMEEKNEENRVLMNEKFYLATELRENENEYESFKAEIKILRQKIEERDIEIEDTIKIECDREKNRFLNEKNEKEDYQRKIEDLTNNLRDTQLNFKNYYDNSSREIHNTKRDYYLLQEEKRIMIKRITELQHDLEYLRDDYEKKNKNYEIYEHELYNLREKYRELTNQEGDNHKLINELENALKDKLNELEVLKNEKSVPAEKMKNEFYKTIDELMRKKMYYKKKV